MNRTSPQIADARLRTVVQWVSPRELPPGSAVAWTRRIADLNGRLLAEYRVILACLMHCDAMRRDGLKVGAQVQNVLDQAQELVSRIESLGGTPAY